MPDSPADGLILGADGRQRCSWCGDHSDYREYHDSEWGRPVTEDRQLFEKLCLEGFQAGLSWLTILRKRKAFRRAFAEFEIERVARYGTRSVERLLADASIVRHRGKIEAAIRNARCTLELRREFGSLAAFVWSFEPPPTERPTRFDSATLMAITTTPSAKAMAKALKKRGFSFVGPTTCYAFMQSMGLVNDHMAGCFARASTERERQRLTRPTEGQAR